MLFCVLHKQERSRGRLTNNYIIINVIESNTFMSHFCNILTQSVPTIKVNGLRRELPVQLRRAKPKAVGNQLAALNRALSQIEDDGNGGSLPATSYPVESIERPRRKMGAKMAKRLSYVERSYNRLTNDVYSEESIVGPSEYTATDLDKWVDAEGHGP